MKSTTLKRRHVKSHKVFKPKTSKPMAKAVSPSPIPVDSLLINGYVWDNPYLTDAQRDELDAYSRYPDSTLIRETLERNGKRVTIWRYIGVRPAI